MHAQPTAESPRLRVLAEVNEILATEGLPTWTDLRRIGKHREDEFEITGVIRVIRGRDRIAEVKIASLKRVKDDAREVQEGLECGILLEGSTDIQVGDLLEAWEQKKVARTLA